MRALSRFLLIFPALLFVSQADAAVNVPLTVQEALYPGSVAGVTRTASPVTIGIPLPDDPTKGVTDVNQLTLSGASVGQFRVLGRWPSGRIKWVLVDTQASVSAGQTNTSIALTDGGSGNFGGSNLATDNGSNITVNTGAAVFTIKKANFNVVDQVVVGGATVVASGASQGLALTGPGPVQTSCPCTTLYTSANDPNSAAVIEENGPAKTVIKATGSHVDASGNVYMRFTARMYFYKGSSAIKITSILRNAEYGISNSFATAYKGHQGYELRLGANLSGTLNYTIANHTATPTTGTMSGSDSVYLYNGDSKLMVDNRGWPPPVTITDDTGYSVVKNGTQLVTGTNTQYPQGWADISNASGAGIEIGVYQLAAYGPKSLEFNSGGSDVRIGILARENSKPYYQAWPQWNIQDVFVNFHSSAPASAAAEFLKFQHYLVGRAPRTQYNVAAVFPYVIEDPTEEDSYYASLKSAANPAVQTSCCLADLGINGSGTTDSLYVERFWDWAYGGGSNQTDFRWAQLLNFLGRGQTGRYLSASHFYKLMAEQAWAHSDGFNWRDRPHFNQSGAELDTHGRPAASSANSTLSFRDWLGPSQGDTDAEHAHWWGMPSYYFLSGDETIKDALLDGTKDWFLNTDTEQAGTVQGGMWNSRAVGGQLIGAARFYQFLSDIGDPDAAAVLAQGTSLFNANVKPDLCVSGYPTGCTFGPVEGDPNHNPWTSNGISRVRGIHTTQRDNGIGDSGWCGGTAVHDYRAQAMFMGGILLQGLWEFTTAKGAGWSDYQLALDLAYGQSQFLLSEGYNFDGSGSWAQNGFRYYIAMDVPNNCDATHYDVRANQTVWFPFFIQHQVTGGTSWQPKFEQAVQRLMSALGTNADDLGAFQIGAVIDQLKRPGSATLSAVPVTGVTDNGGGSYTVSWTVPSGAQSYRIKWGSKQIVDWIGFDPGSNAFTGDPVNTMNWFAATNVSSVPAPAAAGSTQSVTISTGTTGLKAANFSVKAFVSGGSGTTSSGATSLVLVSGNNQTGAVGQALTSPLTVKVTDANGNGVSAIGVTFTVTGGGGRLSTTQVTTDSQGNASAVLTLGPNAGSNVVTAVSGSLAGSPVTFTATATATTSVTAANLVSVSGNNQSGTAGQQLASPFVVKVTDAQGNPVSGTTVVFTATSGSGTLSTSQATTDSQGLASVTLTLGSAAGTNTVTAASGALTGSPITFTATATSGSVSATGVNVAWTNQPRTATWPGFNSWLTISYDPISQQTILYGIQFASTTIYSSDLFFYKSTTNTWTHVGRMGSTTRGCPADTATQPGDRHPAGNMAIDTKRGVLWLAGGVCESVTRQDMYFLKLNPDPTTDTWTQVSPAHYPMETRFSSMVYDPDDDVLFSFGYDYYSSIHDNWVYCPTNVNPTPGVLTAKQSAAGCASPDDWSEVAVVGGIRPAGTQYPQMVYDTVTKKVILYGGADSYPYYQGARNDTWAYDVPTRTWRQKALSTTPPPIDNVSYVPLPAMAYNTATHKIIYHQTANTGAPADWQYDPVADTWTKLSSSGNGGITGPGPIGTSPGQVMVYDAGQNVLVAFGQVPNDYHAELWQGSLSNVSITAPPPTRNPCDLNGDGVVDSADVQAATNQALGTATCGSADLTGEGVCTVIDVQRIINAGLGKACQTGP